MASPGRLAGKCGAVFGFASTRSLAWAIAEAWNREGASLTVSIANDRFRPALEKATASWARKPHVVACDVGSDESIAEAWRAVSAAHGGRLHLLAHSIAYAPQRSMKEPFVQTTREDFLLAHSLSAYSLVALARGALPLMEAAVGPPPSSSSSSSSSSSPAAAPTGFAPTASIIALSYIGAQRAVGAYRVMGAAKASLEASARHLALELGPRRIRVNTLSPGPIDTLAARGIPGFTTMKEEAAHRSPLGRGIVAADVGGAATFLASDDASGITGQTIYVDTGFSAVL